jgi:hypothetical protein
MKGWIQVRLAMHGTPYSAVMVDKILHVDDAQCDNYSGYSQSALATISLVGGEKLAVVESRPQVMAAIEKATPGAA